MFQFFSSIVDLIGIVINFVVESFQLLFLIVSSIIKSLAWLLVLLQSLPPWLMAFVVVPICLSILFQVLNKGS